MLIRNILKKTHEDFLELREPTDSVITGDTIADVLMEIEIRLSWETLINLYDSSKNHRANAKNMDIFKAFLAARWERIKGLQGLHYTFYYAKPFTLACESLATDLARYYKKMEARFRPADYKDNIQNYHRLKLLMPTMNSYNQVLQADLSELDKLSDSTAEEKIPASRRGLQLNHFLLDDNEHIIDIKEALESSAQDGVIKHTSVMINISSQPHPQPKILDAKTTTRVIYHSDEACNYYSAIKKTHKAKETSNTAYTAVMRLISDLQDGNLNSKRGGSETIAGRDAYDGVLLFYQFLQKLALVDYNKLMSLCSQERPQYGIRFKWYLLVLGAECAGTLAIPPEEYKEAFDYCEAHTLKGQVHNFDDRCVYWLGKDINDIVKVGDNKAILQSIVPKDSLVSGVAETKKVDDAFTEEKKALRLFSDALLSKNHFHHLRPFGQKDHEIFKGPSGKQINQYALASLIPDANSLAIIVNMVPVVFHQELFTSVWDLAFLTTRITTLADLIDYIRAVGYMDNEALNTEFYQPVALMLKALGATTLQNMLNDYPDVKRLHSYISKEDYSSLNEVVSQQFLEDLIRKRMTFLEQLFSSSARSASKLKRKFSNLMQGSGAEEAKESEQEGTKKLRTSSTALVISTTEASIATNTVADTSVVNELTIRTTDSQDSDATQILTDQQETYSPRLWQQPPIDYSNADQPTQVLDNDDTIVPEPPALMRADRRTFDFT